MNWRLRVVLLVLSAGAALSKRGRGDTLLWFQKIAASETNDQLPSLFDEILGELQESKRLGDKDLDFIDEEVKQLEEEQIDVVTIFETHYPRSLTTTLGDRAPLFLFYRGNAELFRDISIGFCGSRHASDKGLDVCRDIVEQLVEERATIVAGYAAGVDQVAHRAALQAGGKTIAVLPEGILHFNVRQMLSHAWDWTRTLVVSEFLPHARWAVAKAMQRNRTIVGLSQALVVIEAKETGGTFEAGREALALEHPLFAPIYENIDEIARGNKILVERGAIPIMKSKSTGRAKLLPVIEQLKKPSTPEVVAQPALAYRK